MIKQIINVIRNIAFGIAVIIFLAVALCFTFHVRADVVLSGSMEPEMGTGSLAFTKMDDKDIKEGDIICFQAGSATVAHRVIDITDAGYITKGDNNENQDLGIVTDEMVIGTVFFWIPKLGYLIKWLSSKPGVIVIVTVSVCLILLSQLPGIKDNEEIPEWDEDRQKAEAIMRELYKKI